ncbi:unnamed protein product [Psylliodes chrysocephalus]|uniref:Uncharacterized protein n=1 Tax=Psylliodes chrysocephalus TaxID=3402493 RepID=A0A9P0CYA4_9CUCU|nr:unnamed protein product [Psylliodes chrysocephala]
MQTSFTFNFDYIFQIDPPSATAGSGGAGGHHGTSGGASAGGGHLMVTNTGADDGSSDDANTPLHSPKSQNTSREEDDSSNANESDCKSPSQSDVLFDVLQKRSLDINNCASQIKNAQNQRNAKRSKVIFANIIDSVSLRTELPTVMGA